MLDVIPLVGCTNNEGTGDAFPCTEQGIRDAIAEGGGPHFFACSGPTAIAAQFTIDNDVALDGEDKLETDAIEVLAGVTAELSGIRIWDQFIWADGGGVYNYGDLRMTNCSVGGFAGGGVYNDGTLTFVNSWVVSNWHVGIWNKGTLTITDSRISGNANGADYEDVGAGIHNTGTLTLTNSTVAANRDYGLRGSGGIYNAGGVVTLTNSTVSGNDGYGAGGVFNTGTLAMANSTVSGNGDADVHNEGMATVMNSLIDGDCEGDLTSDGGNIESPGNTCGFDKDKGDQVDVSEAQLNLGELADNGGPTMTHALQTDPVLSAAINRIPEEACEVLEDQRGEQRPETGGSMCDVGSYEVQPQD